jgi:hypothetical protein
MYYEVKTFQNTTVLTSTHLYSYVMKDWSMVLLIPGKKARLICICEILSQVFGPGSYYSRWGSTWLSSVPSGKCSDSSLN